MANPADLENGDPGSEARRDTVADAGNEKMGEYQGLVRYISTYREGKAVSVHDAEDEHDAGTTRKRRFWHRGARGADGAGFDTPDEWLETDMKHGLSEHEVTTRRKKTGWNELTTEKENPILQFLGYFNGPILWGKSSAVTMIIHCHLRRAKHGIVLPLPLQFSRCRLISVLQ